jgi:type IX secretion system PorP/SprF family membrane protein
MRKVLLLISLFFLSFINVMNGQDPHFSQYFSSPMTLNPAMAGYFTGEHRLNSNFRQQWRSMGAPFVTGTIGYDTKLMPGKIADNDVFGLGILALYDQSLNGGFKNVNLSASLSYRKALDAEGINSLGVGFQFTYASRSINFNELNFANQFDGFGFNTSLPSYEGFGSSRRNYLDINAGLLYVHKNENTELYLGGSLYHLGKPNTSFLKNEKFLLPMRYTVHAGSRFTVGTNSNELFVGGVYMQQAGATEKNVGIAYGHSLNDVAKIYAGTWYRFDDAIIPYVGLDYNSFQVGLSYDITTSSLKNYGPKSGSFELSLNLLIKKPKNVYTNYTGKMF